MTLEIRLSNFFSINEEVILDLRAADIKSSKAKRLDKNVFEEHKNKLLKTIVIYGANASGKTNLIKAIRFCHALILESHNHNENTVYNFQPFKFNNKKDMPSSYFIRFMIDGIEYEYSYTLTRLKILTESLYYYPKNRIKKIFSREEAKGKTKEEKYSFGSVINRPFDVAENTSEKTLYISRASQMDREIAKEIFNYFNRTFILDYFNIQDVAFENPFFVDLFNENKLKLLKALEMADSDIIDIKLKKNTKKEYHKIPSDDTLSGINIFEPPIEIITYHKSNPNIPFNFLQEESSGTINFFFTMISMIHIVEKNKTLLIDEIDKSLHTSLVEYIFTLFNAGKKSQLICTTHNTNLLNLNKFRKDQIFFVNKKEDASTDLYSLYDYKDFRDTMDLENAYLQGRFDAVPYINDSSGNIKKIIDE